MRATLLAVSYLSDGDVHQGANDLQCSSRVEHIVHVGNCIVSVSSTLLTICWAHALSVAFC